MGKRYYCDFCDKSIPNNSDGIKKHNQGSQHQALRNSYYLRYKDLETILGEEREKSPCSKYFSYGYCSFGDLCRDSHRTPEQKQQLEDLYRYECHKKVKIEEEKQRTTEQKKRKNIRSQSHLSDHLEHQEANAIENFFPKYFMPTKIKNLNLTVVPPSLEPPNFKDFINYEPNSWGNDEQRQ